MNSETVKISVVIPVYNSARTLSACVESVLNSTFTQIEVILVDDASVDESREIMASLAAGDPRVRLASLGHNMGVSAARNKGIALAGGAYIAFVDSDDYISPDIYETCARVIDAEQPDMICFHYAYVHENGDFEIAPRSQIPCGKLLDRAYILQYILPTMVNIRPGREYFIENYTPIKLFRRSIIQHNHIRFDENRRRWEDRLFQVMFLKYAQSFYGLADCGYYYVVNGTQDIRKYDVHTMRHIVNANREYKQIIGDLYDLDPSHTAPYYCRLSIRSGMDLVSAAGGQYEEKLNMLKEIIESQDGQLLFAAFTPSDLFESRVKQAVLSRNAVQLYRVIKAEYDIRACQMMMKRVLALPGRVFRRLLRFGKTSKTR